MDENIKNLLIRFAEDEISEDELNSFVGKENLVNEINLAIKQNNSEDLELLIDTILMLEDEEEYTNILNVLLITPNHYSHQQIAKTLQSIESPSSLPYIRKALDSGFDYLEYTCSESKVIAKWFSWMLYSIGTKEAIDMIREYTTSADEGIKSEMFYRLDEVEN